MIKLSCADYSFPLLPPAKRFALLALLGFRCVDIGLFERNSGLRPAQLAADPRAFSRRLRSELRNANLRVTDIFLQTGLEPTIAAANDPSHLVRSRNRRMFLLAVELCTNLGCSHLTGLPGVRHQGVDPAGDLALAREEAMWRQSVAAAADVVYAIEPHIGSLCSDIAATRAFVESVPGLTLTLDYGHFVAAGIPSSEIHSLLPHATHVHVRAGAPGKLQTTLEENEIDFAEMVRRLSKRRYRGSLAIEYVWTEWQQCNRTDNVSETVLLRRMLEDLGQKHKRRADLRKEP
jgi:sugar phosphate isomerase/epimerase